MLQGDQGSFGKVVQDPAHPALDPAVEVLSGRRRQARRRHFLSLSTQEDFHPILSALCPVVVAPFAFAYRSLPGRLVLFGRPMRVGSNLAQPRATEASSSDAFPRPRRLGPTSPRPPRCTSSTLSAEGSNRPPSLRVALLRVSSRQTLPVLHSSPTTTLTKMLTTVLATLASAASLASAATFQVRPAAGYGLASTLTVGRGSCLGDRGHPADRRPAGPRVRPEPDPTGWYVQPP